ncbi:Crp/Fnr family transcriptional regulator [Aquimarina sp. AD1]|uniref:Crp/Fnr family transcriptional regulator n=1 Tax=Aquimarina sp. (strain AD1) TaxID=1714848 RepID=UPI000E46F928|nr:Crp/Fnr family transcriptional regulator [Aquimarina sp. AD1]AXT58095.1 Crp/Fnr family transcriptional regulator [Aquimarina sp. AD1]RKN37249.1 Crp/Fnr family transcriptional regulator [Aquimarina sp. AD1]
MISKLITAISKKVSLTKEDIAKIDNSFDKLAISKKYTLKNEKSVSEHLYFIVSGYARIYHLDTDGNEITTVLSNKNNYIASFLPFVNQIPSKDIIETITDCEVLSISYTKMKALIENSENFKAYSVSIFEEAIQKTQHRANDLATLNAEERYVKLMSQEPKIIQNIPLNYIASYLGIAPESLSRIRRKIIS